MPTYEYKCGACGHELEAFQKMSDSPLTDCPECHQSALSKLVSATAFQLKGTGWYVTDTRDKGKPKPDVTASGDTSETKTETKTVDKPKDSTSESS